MINLSMSNFQNTKSGHLNRDSHFVPFQSHLTNHKSGKIGTYKVFQTSGYHPEINMSQSIIDFINENAETDLNES